MMRKRNKRFELNQNIFISHGLNISFRYNFLYLSQDRREINFSVAPNAFLTGCRYLVFFVSPSILFDQ